jgi:hypothetical protein
VAEAPVTEEHKLKTSELQQWSKVVFLNLFSVSILSLYLLLQTVIPTTLWDNSEDEGDSDFSPGD